MMRDPMPINAHDLRVIADALDEVEGTELAANKVLGRIEVYYPDTDVQAGWAARFDDEDPEAGWGFVTELGGAE